MKKSIRFLSLLLSIVMVFGLVPMTAFAATHTGFDYFGKRNTFNSATFTDVHADDWFYDNVKSAYEYGLMVGKENNLFDPEGNLTIAETLTIAARLHSTYLTGKADFEQSSPWYQVYADYCEVNGIADPAEYDLTVPATRAQFAMILANAMPDEALESINKVADDAIPDVAVDDPCGAAVYKLYRAGILTGNDSKGTFAPDSNIRRCEVAAIVTRMAIPSLRKSIQFGDVANPVDTAEKHETDATETPIRIRPLPLPIPDPTPTPTPGPTPAQDTYYTVTFVANADDVENLPAPQQVKSGECAVEPNVPIKDKFVFYGWYLDAEGTTSYNFSKSVSSNITLYANWKSEAEEYYEKTSEIIDVIDVEESENILSESEGILAFEDRGFTNFPVTYQYTLNGEDIGTTRAEASEEKHPAYETFYIAENGDIWLLYFINGEIFASPLSFNSEAYLDTEVLISESETLTSYDNTTNSFFITIPDESEISLVTVDSITASALDKLTVDELSKLFGIVVLASVNEVNTQANDNTANNLSSSLFDSASTATLYESSLTSLSLNAVSDNNDPFIVVSLGDSYSSGEGNEPFIGQKQKDSNEDKPISERVKDENWLAHRSEVSWPSRLTVPGVMEASDTLSRYFVDVSNGETSDAPIQWYFGAVSGALTEHFKTTNQIKRVDHRGDGYFFNKEISLPLQKDIFSKIDGEVDLVTLTIGGNDLGFVDIVTKCVVWSSYLYWGKTGALEDALNETWENINQILGKILQVYEGIHECAPQATIIVAGYPKLFAPEGGGLVNQDEASKVNQKIHEFNELLNSTIETYRNAEMNIYFVNVESAFNEHGAYSKNGEWINPVKLGLKDQDLDKITLPISSYCMHPNDDGLQAYADRVNEAIEGIFEKPIEFELKFKDSVTDSCLSTNKISMQVISVAGDNTGDNIYRNYDDSLYEPNEIDLIHYTNTLFPDLNCSSNMISLPKGTYEITFSAEGYQDAVFSWSDIQDAEFVIDDNTNEFTIYMTPEGASGTCNITGTITIADEDTDMTNNLPLEGAKVMISKASMSKSTVTDSNGAYSLTNIPTGTYTVYVTRDGFIQVVETLIISDTDTEIYYNAAIEAIPEAYEGVGFASGTIYDVATGLPVNGMTLFVRNGINNTTGDVVLTIYDSDSTYSTGIGLEAGNYTIQIVDERTGIDEDARYITNHINIKILGGMNIGNQNGYISNKLYEEEIRVVLTWGQNPSDLDSHLVGPTGDGGKYHIYYSDKTYGGLADLDVDDTSSYGPETVTIHTFNEGVYTYAVHDYSNHSSSSSTALANSGAQVKVYRGQNLLLTYNVPTNKDGTLWTVFTYDAATKTFKTVNEVSYNTSGGSDVLMAAPVMLMAAPAALMTSYSSADEQTQDDLADEVADAIGVIFADVDCNGKTYD